ncbi:hypothetical protein [Ktedonospora formicarum]|uniref:Uncharacterized protein n=1 Tax=Ktedonospora formicarum TaxID=2778364 RepID=A0A8J3I284_9CHLR|nr:hypothetical protein [Ktedonospora formicarum]GHO47984.1 hypothetical protein KSX_61470 [Ktedonospora formicarum]
MPLDNRKTSHIQQMVNKSFTGRQRSVVLVTNSAGSYSYNAQAVVFRPDLAIDPQIPDQEGQTPRARVDTVMLAPLGTSFAGVVLIADTPTATALAVQTSPIYEIVSCVPAGILPGGTHLRVYLRRLR